jgi:8-oxo-dGTP diphosphatase
MNEDITKLYGNKVRIRVCGLCWQNDRLLLVNHGKITENDFWAPPGGGLEFGQSIEESIFREFAEETGLEVNVNEFQFIAEFVRPPLHAIELFFAVEIKGGVLKTGRDPEMLPDKQIIRGVEFIDWDSLNSIPQNEKHGIFKYCHTKNDLLALGGFYRI